MLPVIILACYRKRMLAFTMLKSRSELFVGLALVPTSLIVAWAFYFVIGGYSYPLLMWTLGGVGVMMVVHSLSSGLIFVKPKCNSCSFLPLIIEHENLHIAGIHSEAKVWASIKERFNWETVIKPQKVCAHCPIPGHMQAKD